mmetsp:Transcript_25649/g.55850  ORF Transcript_25649/g.55850 Transcript_25649/m.55850 type:complete len:299 (-) Transcript_25649:4017-4913(-)
MHSPSRLLSCHNINLSLTPSSPHLQPPAYMTQHGASSSALHGTDGYSHGACAAFEIPYNQSNKLNACMDSSKLLRNACLSVETTFVQIMSAQGGVLNHGPASPPSCTSRIQSPTLGLHHITANYTYVTPFLSLGAQHACPTLSCATLATYINHRLPYSHNASSQTGSQLLSGCYVGQDARRQCNSAYTTATSLRMMHTAGVSGYDDGALRSKVQCIGLMPLLLKGVSPLGLRYLDRARSQPTTQLLQGPANDAHARGQVQLAHHYPTHPFTGGGNTAGAQIPAPLAAAAHAVTLQSTR